MVPYCVRLQSRGYSSCSDFVIDVEFRLRTGTVGTEGPGILICQSKLMSFLVGPNLDYSSCAYLPPKYSGI
jgi:hypothetical protein